ncbi:unknown [Ruminococcus sp. CAG:403]|nr:unknown [Ruminococcus sp. CAG:403]
MVLVLVMVIAVVLSAVCPFPVYDAIHPSNAHSRM